MSKGANKRRWFVLKSSPHLWGDRLNAKALAHYQNSTICILIFIFGGTAGTAVATIVSFMQGETNYAMLFSLIGFEMVLGFFILFEYRQVKLAAAKQYGLSKREAVRLDIWSASLFDESLERIMRARAGRGR